MGKVNANDLIERFQFELLAGEEGIYRPITTSDISRPGIEMAGFFTYYPAKRIQLIGITELSFFERLATEEKKERMLNLCTYDTPAIILSRGLEVPPELVEAAEENGVPLLRSPMTTTRLSGRITDYLESELAPMTAVHGVLVDIYGIGVLITGSSGVGKSETALDLIRRGHRLVADDSVEIRQEHGNTLIGKPPELLQHLLEIRGLGIINAMTLFGAGAVRPHKRIVLCIHLELWDQKKAYDRLGLEEEMIKIMDTDVPKLTIPVRPGRNLAVLIEVAAMNHRLKKLGFNAAQDFSTRLTELIEESDNEEY
ncbi:phosphorylase [Alkalihalobacillus alcalophilus ATCC 27647 = CGMCC 1.3604]|uniref:HPr kinase/phosphorylase n=1 Tax=Alkalihalobacillus alcalophilus ATCC 27647 = CGMCC 1.3604 TaxID=1218173 RepID=A0A094WFG8_ALKAL|nr:HPr(Ser) kinase/phosphatase [Alkalihalobacillus alcalophilus]KGA95511.1 serine kinase [Alkalihalobacillus alcalophilus ATCC 27647 = CGMCC 1.3604]MED1562994.1 HPr(Ser) kinase/phosphatase [Alkalihalobacillus alcalophilus]THG88931.1 phosphorylase [Alkalihalobacillus alcalophilus ATCC 27647 = CGMCC 1.3604]